MTATVPPLPRLAAMLALRTVVQPYAWGRTDGMAPHLGTPATGRPEAELWVGTHPGGPATVEGEDRTLASLIASDPTRFLGADLAAKGLTALPFLLKVLAIGSPLSLQAHPSADQAEEGFAREETAGVALADPRRTYRDPNPKPEALVALVDTWALCGFRTPDTARELASALDLPALAPLLDRLDGPDGIRDAFAWLLHLGGDERTELVNQLAERLPADARAPVEPDDPAGPASTRGWIARLQAAFTGDPTVLAPLLVDIVLIRTGESVHLPAGYLHAYLDGAGIEIMAASDNVLRGGLTPKHIDVDELLHIVRFEPGHPDPPVQRAITGGVAFDCGEDAFLLAAVEPGTEPVIAPAAPSLLLATGGPVRLDQDGSTLELDAGRAAFVAPGEPPITVTGTGRLWWATTGDGIRVP